MSLWINRWRARHGFGVHSPFAYSFIRDVICGRHPYYHFDHEVKSKDEQLLYRVAARLNPPTVCCLGRDAEAARRVIRLALPRVNFVDEATRAEFVFWSPGCRLPQHPVSLYAIDADAGQIEAYRKTSGAMTFRIRRRAIGVVAHGLPGICIEL